MEHVERHQFYNNSCSEYCKIYLCDKSKRNILKKIYFLFFFIIQVTCSQIEENGTFNFLCD